MTATKRRVEFPLGEIFTLGPLIAMAIIPKPTIDPRGITRAHRFTAQGLEGLAFVEVEEDIAQAILHRLGKNRCCIRPTRTG